MRRGIFIALASSLLAGCTSPRPSSPNTPSLLLIDGEARGGAWHGPRFVTSVAASVGVQPSSCCGLDIYVARSYFAPENKYDIDPLARVELTDIGLGFTAAVNDRARFRFRGGLTGEPPRDQDFMRVGVSADAAVLVRVAGALPETIGASSAQVDLVLGGQAWSLGQRRTSAGPQGDPERVIALTTGLRISFDYGVDFR